MIYYLLYCSIILNLYFIAIWLIEEYWPKEDETSEYHQKGFDGCVEALGKLIRKPEDEKYKEYMENESYRFSNEIVYVDGRWVAKEPDYDINKRRLFYEDE